MGLNVQLASAPGARDGRGGRGGRRGQAREPCRGPPGGHPSRRRPRTPERPRRRFFFFLSQNDFVGFFITKIKRNIQSLECTSRQISSSSERCTINYSEFLRTTENRAWEVAPVRVHPPASQLQRLTEKVPWHSWSKSSRHGPSISITSTL